MKVHELISALRKADQNDTVSAYNSEDATEFDIHVASEFKRAGIVLLSNDDRSKSGLEVLLHKDTP